VVSTGESPTGGVSLGGTCGDNKHCQSTDWQCIVSRVKDATKQHGLDVFRAAGGVLRASQAISRGIHPRVLYALRDEGLIAGISRGLYCLADHRTMDQPDLVAASLRVPRGVVCLISALSFHGITTQIPHEVSVAILRTINKPNVDYPPIRFFLYRLPYFEAGIEEHDIAGTRVRVYCPEKTIADCFRFRNRIGMGVALEALRLYRERRRPSPRKLLHYAAICRVERTMTPYLEAEFSPRAVSERPSLDYAALAGRASRTLAARVAEAAARYADARKRVIIIAGPNGAGKTTFAREFLPREARCPAFVNADYIAAGLSPFDPDAAAIKAAKLMLSEIGAHVQREESFALETTLAGHRYAREIAAWRKAGYGVKLIFLSLCSVELAIRRVAARVVQGGHNIPEATIRRRYAAGWDNFNAVYKPLVDAWALYDNSGPQPRLIEEGENE